VKAEIIGESGENRIGAGTSSGQPGNNRGMSAGGRFVSRHAGNSGMMIPSSHWWRKQKETPMKHPAVWPLNAGVVRRF